MKTRTRALLGALLATLMSFTLGANADTYLIVTRTADDLSAANNALTIANNATLELHETWSGPWVNDEATAHSWTVRAEIVEDDGITAISTFRDIVITATLAWDSGGQPYVAWTLSDDINEAWTQSHGGGPQDKVYFEARLWISGYDNEQGHFVFEADDTAAGGYLTVTDYFAVEVYTDPVE